MKASTVALIVQSSPQGDVELLDVLSDEKEINILENQVGQGQKNPLKQVYDYRTQQEREDQEFADYVEDLLSQPFIKPEIQQHGVQWLKSKIRIEQYQKQEADAARIIAQYALKVFAEDSKKTDLMLASVKAQVRVKIFVVSQDQVSAA